MSNTNKLLINSNPIQVLPELAEQIGLNEAIFLQQLHYWLNNDCAKYIDEKYWIYNSYKNWKRDNFPFWSESTIKRIALKLEKMELIIVNNYNSFNPDKTKWYTINYENLKPYELKSENLKKQRRLDKQKEIDERDVKKITRAQMNIKNLESKNINTIKTSKIDYGQIDPTEKQRDISPNSNTNRIEDKGVEASNVEWDQIDPRHRSICTEAQVNLHQAIPETTEETTTENTNNNNRESGNTEITNTKKDVVVNKENDNFINETTDENIKELQIKWIDVLCFHLKPGISKDTLKVKNKTMKKLIETYGIEKINRYLDNHNCFNYGKTPTGLMIRAIENDYAIVETKAPTYQTAANNGQPIQATNFEQREYTDEFFESLYDNY